MKIFTSNYQLLEKSDFYKNQLHIINLAEVIDYVNQNELLKNAFKAPVKINFINFSKENKIKNALSTKLKHFLNIPLPVDVTHYNPCNNTVYITEDIFVNKEGRIKFSQHLFSQLGVSDSINFTVLHELGHAAYASFYVQNAQLLSNPEHNKTIDFINENVMFFRVIPLYDENIIFRGTDLNYLSYNATTEGFAELFAAVAVTQIYSKERAIKIIEKVIEAREYADQINECYCSKKSLAIFLNDFKNDNVYFSNFEDIHNYISKIIAQNFENILTKHMSNISINKNITLYNIVDQDGKEIDKLNMVQNTSVSNNRYLGFINARYELNLDTANEVAVYLNKKYDFNLGSIEENFDAFEEGMDKFNEYKKLPEKQLDLAKKRVKQNILSIKTKQIDNKYSKTIHS